MTFKKIFIVMFKSSGLVRFLKYFRFKCKINRFIIQHSQSPHLTIMTLKVHYVYVSLFFCVQNEQNLDNRSIHCQSFFQNMFCLTLIHYGWPVIIVYILDLPGWFSQEIADIRHVSSYP